MLAAWGKLLKRSIPPDVATVRDVTEGLDTLDDSLNELIAWLEDQTLSGLLQLQGGILEAQKTWWPPESQAALSIYLRRCGSWDNATDLDTELWYETQRITVGRNIVRFANALERALRAADEARSHE